MTPEQISQLPPELRKTAESSDKETYELGPVEFMERLDALPAALSYILQVQERLELVRTQRDTGADFVIDVARILGKHCPNGSATGLNPRQIAQEVDAKLLQVVGERDRAIAMHEKEESTPCECCATIATLTAERDEEKAENTKDLNTAGLWRNKFAASEDFLKVAQEKLATAEAEASRLRGELEKINRIASVANVSSDPLVYMKAIGEISLKLAALSHPSEGAGTQDYRQGGK